MSDLEKKGKLQKPDKSCLIGKQKDAYESLEEFIEGGKRMFCLEGFAGCGKTFITNMFVQDMIHQYDSRICVAAPTHKAVAVIRRMAEFKSDNLDYSTIHSLLGLRPYITNHGKETFVKDSQSTNRVGEFDILIIDETSQLDDQLFVYLMQELDDNPYLKIIFVGDGKQLPPVNHVSSIPMNRDKRKDYKIEYAALTEIVRQKDGNPLIDLSKEFRKFKYEPRTMINKETKDGVVVVDRKNRRKVLETLFTSGEYENNGDFCRATAWTNTTVNWYNVEIRKMIYKKRIKNRINELKDGGMSEEDMIPLLKGEFPYWNKGVMNLPNYLIGDKVIVDKPVFDSNTQQIIFQTNEELIIEDLTIENRIGRDQMYKCYILDVKNIFTGKKEIIEVVHDDDVEKFKKHQKKLKDRALQQKVGTKQCRDSWVIYYDLDKRFAKLKYAPCLTTYKSQGSTYDNIIVICDDILRNRKQREVFQHLYVGVTRARHKAFLFI